MGLNLTDQTTFQEGWVKSQLPTWVSLPLPLTSWSGRRGKFPSPASHRSGRAPLRHPAPLLMVLLRDDKSNVLLLQRVIGKPSSRGRSFASSYYFSVIADQATSTTAFALHLGMR